MSRTRALFDPQSTIVLDVQEARRLLLMAANGTTRLSQVHVLVCLCGATADLREDPSAWNGWRVVPLLDCTCPACLECESLQKTQQHDVLYPSQAQKQFAKSLEQVLLRKVRR